MNANVVLKLAVGGTLLGALLPGVARAQAAEEALDRFIHESMTAIRRNSPASGSLYVSQSFLAEPARDPKAARVGDLVTVLIAEEASALSSGSTSQTRDTEADNSITRFLGLLGATSGLANLLEQSGQMSLDGQGSTGRQASVTTTMTSYVTHVMPNGDLVVQGTKEVGVNSERQLVQLRGVVRTADLNPDNSVSSDRIALMDLRVNGRGVVNDAIRRPNIVYRIFQRILPF